jgi:gluconate kinase
MSEAPTCEASSSSYVVILSGTHVTGKEIIAVSLSKSLNCPWLKGEFAANSANVISRSQEKRGYDPGTVYGKTWFKKMQRIGLMSDGSESDGGGDSDNEDRGKKKKLRKKETGRLALVTHYALRKSGRDAIRDVMLAKEVRVIFVILQITKDTLSGRTLGAENPELAERIMKEKAEDLREPEEEERDVLVVDSMQDVDALTLDIEEMIRRQVAVE